eukprot:5586271-Pyramimonas_sp.AAC.1
MEAQDLAEQQMLALAGRREQGEGLGHARQAAGAGCVVGPRREAHRRARRGNDMAPTSPLQAGQLPDQVEVHRGPDEDPNELGLA